MLRALLASGLVLAAACGGDEPAPPPTPVARETPAPRPHGLGADEVRIPQPFTLEQRLLDAVRRNDRTTIARALELGAPVGAKDDLGRSTVLLAVKDAANLDLVRWLHEKGAPVDETDVNGRSPLSFAAEAGALDQVRWLVEAGAQVDRADGESRTPLFHAALGDHADVVGYLHDRGADPNHRDRFQDTPLMVACAKGHASTAALLRRRGADASLRDQEGRTAKERSAPGTKPCLTDRPD
jgi:ankyrin repeat protein